MEKITIDFWIGTNPTKNQKANELLIDLQEHPGSSDEQIWINRWGESDNGFPTILYETLSFTDVNEIQRFCEFMKKSPVEQNEIVEHNFSQGFIGF